jgi:hypothetical protein
MRMLSVGRSGTIEDRRPAPANDRPIHQAESRTFRGFHRCRELFLGNMTAWFSYEELSALPERPMQLAEETRSIRQLMNHGKSEREVDRAGKIVHIQQGFARQACVDPVVNRSPARAPLQARDHFGLQVNGHHLAARSDKPRYLDGEKAHATARFQDLHPFRYEWPEYGLRVLPQPPQRVGKKITEPPRTNSARHAVTSC